MRPIMRRVRLAILLAAAEPGNPRPARLVAGGTQLMRFERR